MKLYLRDRSSREIAELYVFHIGLHKTGTSTLQALMAANARALETREIVYPILGEGSVRAQHELQFAIRRGQGITAPVWNEFRALRDRAREQTVVASSEGFSLRSVDPRLVRAGIGGDEARVIVYVRDLLAWTVSAYCQEAKQGKFTKDFDEYLVGALDDSARYADRVLPWAEAFGHENVRIRSLDRGCLVNGNLIDDFLAALGTTREGLVVPPNVNETPDWRVVELLRDKHARHFAATGAEWQHGVPALRHISRTGLAVGERLGWKERAEYLTREQRRLLAARYQVDRERLLAAIPDSRISGITSDLDRERPFLPSPEAVPEADRRAFEEAFAEMHPKRQADGTMRDERRQERVIERRGAPQDQA